MALIRGGLRTRLVLVTMLIATLLMAAVIVLVQVYLARVSDADSTRLARARADAVAGTVRLRGGRAVVLESRADPLDRGIWVFDNDGRLVEGTLPASGGGAVTALGTGPAPASRVLDDRVRLASRPVTLGGHRAAVVVAAVDLTPYEDGERRGLWVSVVLALLTVVASGVAAAEAARHALHQVRHMVRSAQEWEEHDLGRRFAMGDPVDEITELGRTLDRMLDRIAEALHSERRLSDEVAHELRTPLTVIRTEAELALLRAGPEQQEPLRAIVEAAERVDGAVGSMLDAARSRHDQEATADVVRLLRELEITGPEVALPTGPPVRVAAPPALVQSALRPLVDNAVRHARTRVELTVRRTGDRVVVGVLDDGPGVPPDQLARIFSPGHRGEVGGSAGLGLSVVRRLVESVGGTVRARPGDGGDFEIELPAAD